MEKQSEESFTEILQRQGGNYFILAPDITNLESTSEIMQWSNGWKKKGTHRVLNKPFKWNVPIGNQHAIFYTLYKLPQKSQEYMLCIQIVYIGLNLT